MLGVVVGLISGDIIIGVEFGTSVGSSLIERHFDGMGQIPVDGGPLLIGIYRALVSISDGLLLRGGGIVSVLPSNVSINGSAPTRHAWIL